MKKIKPSATSLSPEGSGGVESRQMILETAARLFSQDGYAVTSLRAIASACDMKAGSLYYHFESKDQIVTEVLNIGVQRVFDAVKAAVEALPADAGLAQTLQCAIETHLEALLEAQDFTSANIRIFGQVPAEVRNAHMDLRKRYENYWRNLLSSLESRGEIRPGSNLQRTVFFLFGAMNWTTEWYDKKKTDITVVAAELAELVVNGLKASASPSPAPGVPKKPKQGKR